jgi:hypothetical protein
VTVILAADHRIVQDIRPIEQFNFNVSERRGGYGIRRNKPRIEVFCSIDGGM